MLSQQPKNKGQLRRRSEKAPRENIPTLAEVGIDKKLSSRARKLAVVPEDEIERGNITGVRYQTCSAEWGSHGARNVSEYINIARMLGADRI